MESPFDVLGVDPDADDAAIERAYRRRVKEVHPDQGGSVEQFHAVRAAYEELGCERRGTRPTGREGGDDRSPASDPSAGSATEVAYLDYDVLADFGWDLDDDDLFRKAAAADLDASDHGRFRMEPGESLLEGAEGCGFAWPFACRGGACANCAVLLREGELSMPVNHVLPTGLMERGFRLSCNGVPTTDELEVVFNVKHVPELDELLLPPRPFERTYADD